FADDAKPAQPPVVASNTPRTKVPLRVVKVLAETHQVLLFDKIRGTHVLADVGKTIEGYTIDDIDDDEVTLTTSTGAQIVLVVPVATTAAQPAKPKTEAAPADPYEEPKSEPAKQPVDPYEEAEPAKTAPAPAPAPAPPVAKDPTQFVI